MLGTKGLPLALWEKKVMTEVSRENYVGVVTKEFYISGWQSCHNIKIAAGTPVYEVPVSSDNVGKAPDYYVRPSDVDLISATSSLFDHDNQYRYIFVYTDSFNFV